MIKKPCLPCDNDIIIIPSTDKPCKPRCDNGPNYFTTIGELTNSKQGFNKLLFTLQRQYQPIINAPLVPSGISGTAPLTAGQLIAKYQADINILYKVLDSVLLTLHEDYEVGTDVYLGFNTMVKNILPKAADICELNCLTPPSITGAFECTGPSDDPVGPLFPDAPYCLGVGELSAAQELLYRARYVSNLFGQYLKQILYDVYVYLFALIDGVCNDQLKCKLAKTLFNNNILFFDLLTGIKFEIKLDDGTLFNEQYLLTLFREIECLLNSKSCDNHCRLYNRIYNLMKYVLKIFMLTGPVAQPRCPSVDDQITNNITLIVDSRRLLCLLDALRKLIPKPPCPCKPCKPCHCNRCVPKPPCGCN